MKLYVNCPGKPFALTACVFLKGEIFTPECPYRVMDAQGKTYDTQWSLVAMLDEGIQVEFAANIDTVKTGSQVFTLSQGSTVQGLPTTDFSFLPLLDQMKILVRDQSVFDHVIPINFLSNLKIDDIGVAQARLSGHFASPSAKIGVHAFLNVKSHRNSWELTLNFHNAFKNTNHFYFDFIELVLPAGFEFSEVLPYKTKENSLLVPSGLNMIPSRRQFSRRLYIHKTETTPDPITQGVGFGNYFHGGYLIQNFPVGHIKNANEKVQKDYESTFAKLLNNHPDSTGGPIVSNRLWSSASGPYGGATGGVDIEQCTDADGVDAKNPNLFLTIIIRSLRYRNRQMGPIIENNGEHFAPESMVTLEEKTPWQIFNNVFQKAAGKTQDTPFGYSTAVPSSGSCPYQNELLNWAPIDHQHLKRITRSDQSLAWLMNDPLARMYLIQDAELQKMAFWPGAGGRFNSFGAVNDGMEPGREYAWVLDCVATAAAIDKNPIRAQKHKDYVLKAVDFAYKNQLPTGWLNTRRSGKVVTDYPFSNQYYGGQTYEACFTATALMGAFQVLGHPKALWVLQGLLKAIRVYARQPNSGHPTYVVPTHKKQADGTYLKLDKIPSDFNYLKEEKYNAGVLIGLAKSVEMLDAGTSLDSAQWFLDFTGKPDMISALAEIEKLQTGQADTSNHQANTIAMAQKYIGGVFE